MALGESSGITGRPYRRFKAAVFATCPPICAVCGEKIDKTLRYPHPMSISLEHLVPRSHGGAVMDRRNAGVSHLAHNRSRGNKPLPVKHSRVW